MEQKLLETLKKHWHYDSFRPMQREAMESVLSGRDTLVLMPTGGGKSLIYQVPTMASEGVCIVITPLIALMKDQVDNLRRRGIPAVAVHSGLTARQIDIALDNCIYGDVKFLYIAPERISSQEFQLRVDRMKVAILAVEIVITQPAFSAAAPPVPGRIGYAASAPWRSGKRTAANARPDIAFAAAPYTE